MKKKSLYRIIGGRKIHVNYLASQSRLHSVSNCTIKKVSEVVIKQQGDWKNPENGFKQPEPLHKKGSKLVYNKETKKTERVYFNSNYPNTQIYQKKLWKNLGKAAKMEAYTQEKLKKWEKKHPKPCPTDDLFKDEYIPKWEAEKEQALIRIRDFVVSMFDKLPLTGRFKVNEKDAIYQEKKIADLSAKNGEGHRVNELKPDSKLMKKAQKVTNKEKVKNANLVATNLKDHKRKKGRIILPKAA